MEWTRWPGRGRKEERKINGLAWKERTGPFGIVEFKIFLGNIYRV